VSPFFPKFNNKHMPIFSRLNFY